MTKAELVKAIEQFPDDAPIVVSFYEGGLVNVKEVDYKEIAFFDERSCNWMGDYNETKHMERDEYEEGFMAIHLIGEKLEEDENKMEAIPFEEASKGMIEKEENDGN